MALTTIKAAGLTADLIDETKLADNSIDSEHYNDGSIDTAHIAADQITGALIADDAVGAEHIEVLDADLQMTDAGKIKLGTGNDLQIYHDGTHSYLKEAGTGNFYVMASSKLQIDNTAGDKTMAAFHDGGAVELFHNNVKHFETISGGIRVQGAEGGNGSIELYSDEGDDNADKRRLLIDTNGDFYISNYADGAWETDIMVYQSEVRLYYDNSIKLQTASGGISVTGGINLTTNLSLLDNGIAKFGTGDDLQIYHNGTDSWVKNTTGVLAIAGPDIQLANAAGNEQYIRCVENGAVQIYHDNSLRITTQSWGTGFDANFGGNDNIKLNLGNGDDLQIFHNGSHSYMINATGDLNLRSDANVYIQDTDGNTMARFEDGGKCYLYYNGSSKLFTQSWGAQVAGNFLPDGDNSRNLGASNERWANVYSADIHLNNTGAGGNEVDGSEGNWTIQEGANDLFLINRTNNKKYKFNLTEIT